METAAELIQEEQSALSKGVQEESAGRLDNAEAAYMRARSLAHGLPVAAYHVVSEVLLDLARLYSKQKRLVLAEQTYTERKNILWHGRLVSTWILG